MIPRLLRDVFFVPLDDGVYLRTSHRAVTINNAAVYPWLLRLAPYLDGSTSIQALTSRLPDDKRKFVQDLVATLSNHGMIRDVSLDQPHNLKASLEDIYQGELTYLESYGDSPGYRFQRFRDSRILLIGSGRILESAIRMFFAIGLKRIAAIVCSKDSQTEVAQLQTLDLLRDDEQELRLLTADSQEEEKYILIKRVVGEYEMVVHVSDVWSATRAEMIEKSCAANSVQLAQARVVEDEAWIGRIMEPSCSETLWNGFWFRTFTRRAPEAERRETPDRTDSNSAFLMGSVPSAVASLVVFRCFNAITGMNKTENARILRINLETLQKSTHPLIPHPLALPVSPDTKEQFREKIERLAQHAPTDLDGLGRDANDFVDDRIGIFSSIDEETVVQFPLRVSRIVVNTVDVACEKIVYGVGLEFGHARLEAIWHGLEAYALSMFDNRRLIADGANVWGLNIIDGNVVEVPALSVFSITPGCATSEQPYGVAAGESWEACLKQALVRSCAQVAMKLVQDVDVLAVLSPTACDLIAERNPVAEQYLRIVRQLEAEITVYDLTAIIDVPTIAIQSPTDTQFSSGTSYADALRDALEQLILGHQLRKSGVPRQGGRNLIEPKQVRHDVPVRALQNAETISSLTQALTRHGIRPICVPLDHDPSLSRLTPFIVRLVQTNA